MALAVALLIGAVVLVGIALTWLRYRPRIAALADAVPSMTAYMELRAREGRSPVRHRWVPLDSLPGPVVCAVLAAEDVRFFSHGTLSWTSQRELLSRVLHGDFSRGGSTIAQQLARNLFLAPDRTIRRKLLEYLLAYQISHTLTKERQLELYINLIEWGDGVWGVAAGSEHTFHRRPEQLTPSQAVLLASLLPAPARGLRFAISPARRSKLEVVTRILWRDAILDELAWSGTVARLRRMGEFVDLGASPVAAAEAVTEEMGEEDVARLERAAGAPVRVRCDPTRRGES